MSRYFEPIPFGHSIPIQNPHAVSVSLPLLQNVIDYEENTSEAIALMQSGYPRFFQNKYVEKLVVYVRETFGISSEKIILPIASVHAKSILEYLVSAQFEYVEQDNCVFLILENDTAFVKKCIDYIQNIGLLISSRKAEDVLFKIGLITAVFEEESVVEAAEQSVKNVLAKAYNVISDDAIQLTNCGMNAVFAALESVVQTRKTEGKHIVVQLGWLYVDTMEIIEKQNDGFYSQLNIHNKLQLETWLETHHTKVATLFTEVTTNPLMQCVDLPWLHSLCKKYDIVLIVDVTIATPFNIDVLPHCDIAVESLTKFACGNADVLMGATILNDKSEWFQSFKNQLQTFVIPAYKRDVERLALQIGDYKKRVKTISQNTRMLYNYLKTQPFVKEIYTAYHPNSKINFLKIRKNEDAFPGLISIVFDKDLAYYYDSLPLAKGPSLGTEFTLAMPYVYLAHYEYLKTAEGRQNLLNLGISPDLLRISVGVEPVENIINAFEKLKVQVEDSFIQ